MNSSLTSPAAVTASQMEQGLWSVDEHAKFLEALKTHPNGPWKDIALLVGTRSARQVQTHAKKYFEKVARHVRGLRKDRRRVVRCEHRLDEQIMDLFKSNNTKSQTTDTQMGRLQSGLRTVSLTTLESCSTLGPLTEEDNNWVNRLGVDDEDHFDWLEALLRDDDAQMTTEVSNSDTLMDIDNSYLGYLLHILDTHEEQSQ